jgi:hypothetical protein
MTRIALALLSVVSACGDRQGGERSADHAFVQLQQRGQVAMGVDQYTSYHRFERLPDGGRIVLERDPSDPAGVAQIRRHMQEIAGSFQAGNFALPGFVHGREVPGARVMQSRRARISYIPHSTASGGQLLIISHDSLAIGAIHEFLDFQRHDHRVGADGSAH